MTYFLIKVALSAVIIASVSEIAKRSPAFGALIVSLPLVSMLGMMWLWRDTHDPVRLAAHAEATFWYVLPSLPMFLALPALLRCGFSFWFGLGLCVALTILLYFGTALVLRRFGIAI